MTVPGSIDALLLGGQGSYQIERSLRFNSADSAYLDRTPASAGNRTTWTWSGWVKRASVSTSVYLFVAGASSAGGTLTGVTIDSGGTLSAYWNSSSSGVSSSAVLRDPSAWYHVVASANNATLTVYVNNLQIVQKVGSGAAEINNVSSHRIGSRADGTGIFFDGYLTEINFIDGQALTPSSFGETSTTTGVWQPKKYTGTYGTNGFYLKFADNSGTTSTTLGKDSSGNGNNWTPNNFSVTAGAGNDSLIDTPTPYADGGNGRGNYCTLNPVYKSSSQPTFSNGNLNVAPNAVTYQNSFGTISVTSGKWYAEVTVNGTPNSGNYIGVSSAVDQNYLIANVGQIGSTSSGYSYQILLGNKYSNGANSSYGSSCASGDVIGIALDLDNGKLFFSKNGTWQASGDPVAGTNAAFTGLTSSLGFSIGSTSYSSGSTSFDHNFGQRAFAYTPPSGFLALNTQNLPEPTIKKPNQYFDATLYTGNGTNITVTNSGGFTPDMVWHKGRSVAYSHSIVDAVRGNSNVLSTDTTGAESNPGAQLDITAGGFISTYRSANLANNQNSATYVGWQWKESATPGFDIVTYTGTGSATTVAHTLGVAPSMIIVKRRTGAIGEWWVYHSVLGATKGLALNSTSAEQTSSLLWNNTAPTSSVFSLGTGSDVNASSGTYVAYLWSEVAGFSKFGSYTGNGSTDGPFVYCGFRPRWVMIKRTDSAASWQIYDTARDTINKMFLELVPNSLAEENSVSLNIAVAIDALSNGFKLRESDTAGNASGGTYIFAAFAESPFKYSLAR